MGLHKGSSQRAKPPQMHQPEIGLAIILMQGLVVTFVWHLGKLFPHLDCLRAHELSGRDVPVSWSLGKLLVEVLVFKIAVLLDIFGGGGIEHPVHPSPVACAHTHRTWLRACVQHATAQMGCSKVACSISNGTHFTMPTQNVGVRCYQGQIYMQDG